jgi:hypothetical protein
LVSKSTTGSGDIAHRNASAEVSTGSFTRLLLSGRVKERYYVPTFLSTKFPTR